MAISKYAPITPGCKFGRLTVLASAPHINNRTAWLCKCECGVEKAIQQKYLNGDHTKSCGCLSVDTSTILNTTHGMSHTRTYTIWSTMRARCNNPSHKKYSRYGGRGISICARWNDYELFLADMGEAPIGYSIDRINNNGNYSPSNCRWATAKEQANNTRRNVWLTWAGKTLSISDWAIVLKMNGATLYQRFHKGWDTERVLTQPIRGSVTPAV